MAASTVKATTLYVNCGGKAGLTSIGAALKALQYSEGHGPGTINVSGVCHENVVIQSLDRLSLNAVNGASISDASGGKLDVIAISDSRDVSINGFTINAGSDGVSFTNGILCGDWSSCRLSGNVLQGAGSGAGVTVAGAALATLDGDVLQRNDTGLLILSGSKVRAGGSARPFTSRNNNIGMEVRRGAFAFVVANIDANNLGLSVRFQSTVELANSSITGSANAGALVSEGSFARFNGSNITGNAGGGVVYSDLSMGNFVGTTVTGNGGQTDVLCNPQYSATRGTGTIGTGSTTNCVEP
jgi:hypothetical protein